MKLLAVSVLILAVVAVAALTTKLVGHHTTCTSTTHGLGYAATTATACTTSTGLW